MIVDLLFHIENWRHTNSFVENKGKDKVEELMFIASQGDVYETKDYWYLNSEHKASSRDVAKKILWHMKEILDLRYDFVRIDSFELMDTLIQMSHVLWMTENPLQDMPSALAQVFFHALTRSRSKYIYLLKKLNIQLWPAQLVM